MFDEKNHCFYVTKVRLNIRKTLKSILNFAFLWKNSQFILENRKNAVTLQTQWGWSLVVKILGYGVMVTLQILVLSFLVRVRVSQRREKASDWCSITCLFAFLELPERFATGTGGVAKYRNFLPFFCIVHSLGLFADISQLTSVCFLVCKSDKRKLPFCGWQVNGGRLQEEETAL